MNITPNLKLEGELTKEYALSVLPLFFSVSQTELSEYIEKMRQAIETDNIDRFLILLRDSFTQFLYDDFSQLEQHYRNHLRLVATAVDDITGFRYDYSQKEVIYYELPDKLIVFNLRGSAEDAVIKGETYKDLMSESTPKETIGVSFSAFDRTLDRWTR